MLKIAEDRVTLVKNRIAILQFESVAQRKEERGHHPAQH